MQFGTKLKVTAMVVTVLGTGIFVVMAQGGLAGLGDQEAKAKDAFP